MFLNSHSVLPQPGTQQLMQDPRSTGRKSFDFYTFGGSEGLECGVALRVAASMHYYQRRIRMFASRECIAVALQFSGTRYTISFVN